MELYKQRRTRLDQNCMMLKDVKDSATSFVIKFIAAGPATAYT